MGALRAFGCLEAAAREVEGKTYFEFVIPLDSRDPTDKPPVCGSEYKVLVAYQRTNDDFGALHSEKGSSAIPLDRAP